MPKRLQTGVKENGIQNIPSTLANAIQVLIEDKRSASGYKKVREAALAYDKAGNDDEAAQLLLTNDRYRALYYQKKAVEEAGGEEKVHDNSNLIAINLREMDEIQNEMTEIENNYKLK